MSRRIERNPSRVADCNTPPSLHVASLKSVVNLDQNLVISTWDLLPVWAFAWKATTLLAEIRENVSLELIMES